MSSPLRENLEIDDDATDTKWIALHRYSGGFLLCHTVALS